MKVIEFEKSRIRGRPNCVVCCGAVESGDQCWKLVNVFKELNSVLQLRQYLVDC